MAHQAAPHILQRKMQTNTTRFKQSPQVLVWHPESSAKTSWNCSCGAFVPGLQQRVSAALEPCNPWTLKSWSFETTEMCNLVFLESSNLWTLEPCNQRILQPWNSRTLEPTLCKSGACWELSSFTWNFELWDSHNMNPLVNGILEPRNLECWKYEILEFWRWSPKLGLLQPWSLATPPEPRALWKLRTLHLEKL